MGIGIYDGLKDAAFILKESGKIEQYREILEAQEKMLEMQKRIAELENENKDLMGKLETKGKLIYDKNAYWEISGDKRDGPFCSCCWDDSKKIIRMQPCPNPAYYSCPKCKNKSILVYSEKEGGSVIIEDFNRFSAI